MSATALAHILRQQPRGGDDSPRLKYGVAVAILHPKGAAIAERFVEIEVSDEP
jgi:hypothetical protein